MILKRIAGIIILVLSGVACNSAAPESPAKPEPTAVPDTTQATTTPSALNGLPEGLTAEKLPYSFDRPTQFVIDENMLWVAQLAGRENDTQGQLLRINLDTGEQQTVAQNLDKPTGVAIVGETAWIATRDEILRLDTSNTDAIPEVVLTDLPNNGRSNGTLTLLPSGEILYETSGNRSDEDSGKLWALDPITEEVREVASGLKGGYAHVVGEDGRVWFTEIVDGSLDGVPYPDEINLLEDGGDYGWPDCYGRELLGRDCDGTLPAITNFGAGSTPTGIAISPFKENKLLVALWVIGEIVEVDMTTGDKSAFLDNLGNPQHLFTVNETLWMSDYSTGTIYRIHRQADN